MMRNSLKHLFAAGLVLLSVNALSGCTVQREEVTREEVPMAPQEERPVAGEPGAATNLQELQPGQPLSYYTRQFEQMGYQVRDIDYQDGRVVYDLSRDDRMHQVTLTQPAGENRVQDIQTRELRGVAMDGERRDQAAQRLSQQIDQLPTGRRPVEYISMLNQYGTVTEYRLRDDEATINLEANNRRYRITMDVDPGRQTVTDINLDREGVFELPT